MTAPPPWTDGSGAGARHHSSLPRLPPAIGRGPRTSLPDPHHNIIDTCHVDFTTVEVERLCAVLDGSMTVTAAKGGVESQFETV